MKALSHNYKVTCISQWSFLAFSFARALRMYSAPVLTFLAIFPTIQSLFQWPILSNNIFCNTALHSKDFSTP